MGRAPAPGPRRRGRRGGRAPRGALLGGLLALAWSARAGAAPPPGPDALERLVGAVAGEACGAAGRGGERRLVVRAAGPGALGVALERLLIERLGGCGLLVLARDAPLSLDVVARREGGRLRVEGALARARPPLWARIAGARPGALARLFAEVELDAELEALAGAGPRPGPAARVARAPTFATRAVALEEEQVLDLAAADLDGDGAAEVIVLGPGGLRVLAPGRQLATLAHLPLTGRAAAVRPRSPLGRLLALGGGRLWARRGDEAAGREVAWQGGALVAGAERAGLPLALGPDGAPLVGEPLAGAASIAPPAGAPGLPPLLLALRGGIDRRRGWVAASVDPTGELRTFVGGLAAPGLAAGRAGAALVIADVDGDGAVELCTSAPVEQGEDDVLLVRAWEGGAPGAERARLAIDGGLVALAAGDLDGDGADELLAAVRRRDGAFALWIVD